MKLPGRLSEIASFIPRGGRVVDVGTDHALLPIFLVREGITAGIIAGDLKPGPLAAAAKNVTAAGLEGKITLRLGFGLDIVEDGETDVAVIAGMGGSTIAGILAGAGPGCKGIGKLVLQPMSDAGQLREWLAGHGWRITKEEIISEDGRLYEIIAAEPGLEPQTDSLLIEIGPRLYENRHPLLAGRLGEELAQNQRIIAGLERSEGAEAAAKAQRLKELNRRLEEVIEWLSSAKQS